jgi:hypothetical protein
MAAGTAPTAADVDSDANLPLRNFVPVETVARLAPMAIDAAAGWAERRTLFGEGEA